ncbi:MAG: 30S ribosomal protein S6 [Candidatus Omnitrophica bacterium]|nr:30S ribosomal protein S6 [Candidatus Omnitrophota bacterium]
MVKSEITRKYELMVMVNAKMTQEEKDVVFKQITEIVTKAEGSITNSQVWLDKHKMSFRIKKCNEITYYLVNFTSKSSAITEIKQLLKLNEKVLRFIVINLEK